MRTMMTMLSYCSPFMLWPTATTVPSPQQTEAAAAAHSQATGD